MVVQEFLTQDAAAGADDHWVKDPALPQATAYVSAAAPIQPLAWELPYATGTAVKRKKKNKQKKLQQEDRNILYHSVFGK